MKKLFAVLLALALMLSAVSALADTLTIATSPDFPPFEYLDPAAGEAPVGIEIDILNLICEKLGMELQIEQMDFEAVLPGVTAGKFDLGVSGISVTDQRKKNALFTDPYCLAAQAIVVVEGSPITSKADLDGKKISVQTGTTAETFCMGNGYDVSPFAANADAELALVNGKVDAWVIDDLTAADMVKVYNAEHDVKLVILDDAMTTEPYAFAMAKGQEELQSKLNEALHELLNAGTIQEIFAKYEAPYTAPEAAE